MNGSEVALRYQAVVDGIDAEPVVTDTDDIVYLRPSRYCESDSLAPTAASEFAGLAGLDLLQAVIGWVNAKLTYVAGSKPAHRRRRTYAAGSAGCLPRLRASVDRAAPCPERPGPARRGVCTGMSPMEFHAVAEALVDGQWWVVDATQLAPRQSLLRVATGRDAADTAFLTNFGAPTLLNGLEVSAVVDDFALDDTSKLTQLR